MRPREYEFTPETKILALKRANFRCEDCGVPKHKSKDGYLEIHHVLAVMAAVNYYPNIPHVIIASLANAMVLCKDCHQARDNSMRFDHPVIAQTILRSLVDA